MNNKRIYDWIKKNKKRWRTYHNKYMKTWRRKNQKTIIRWKLKNKSKMHGYEKQSREKRMFGNKELIMKRDKNKCIDCGMTNSEHKKLWSRELTVHHIDGNGGNTKCKNNNPANLKTLCLRCHGRIHGINNKRRKTL